MGCISLISSGMFYDCMIELLSLWISSGIAASIVDSWDASN